MHLRSDWASSLILFRINNNSWLRISIYNFLGSWYEMCELPVWGVQGQGRILLFTVYSLQFTTLGAPHTGEAPTPPYCYLSELATQANPWTSLNQNQPKSSELSHRSAPGHFLTKLLYHLICSMPPYLALATPPKLTPLLKLSALMHASLFEACRAKGAYYCLQFTVYSLQL